MDGRTSVMDYPHPLIKIKRDGTLDLSDAYTTSVGEWDKVSVAYGYQDFAEGIDEVGGLKQILEDSRESGLRFLSDQDARPDAPTGLKATDGTYADRVQLTWNAVNNATVYRIFRCGRACGSPIGYTKSDIFEDTGGNPGVTYYYRVRACTTTRCSNFSVLDEGYRVTESSK